MKFFKSIAAQLSRNETALPEIQDSAGLFFFGTAPSTAQIAELAQPAQVSTRIENGNRTRIDIAWPDVALTITIDPDWDKDYQLSGMRGWLGLFKQPEELEIAQKLATTLEKTSICYGSVVKPAFDTQGKALGLLKALLGQSGGCFFSRQSFYDAQGIRIIGRPGNPAILGTA
jgi:hypothetical protein